MKRAMILALLLLPACDGQDHRPCRSSVDALAAKLASCGVDAAGFENTECVGSDAEQWECTLQCYDTTCDVVTGKDASGYAELGECVIACSR
jgi:hypothetical protein